MSDTAFELIRVSKKFKKGEIYDSLRDLIPAMTGKIFRQKTKMKLEDKEFWAIDNISFKVERGEALGIIGSNGAGKSTILKIISGIMKPTSGKIIVSGRLSALIEVGAGFHPDLTGRENIYLNGTILGMKRKEIGSKFDRIVEFSGLEDFIDTPVKRYSSGMYARLGFSVAAHVDPDILIVDEVLSVGDYLFQKKCIDKMYSVLNGGATVIFVSHNLKAVADLCQNAILLDHGKILMNSDTNSVIKHYLEINTTEDKSVHAKEVYISKVTLRNSNGETVKCRSGEKVWLDIEIKANRDLDKLSLVLDVKDDNFYNIFDTSSERLGYGSFSIKGKKIRNCTFELDMNVAQGTFHFVTTIYRYDIQKKFDSSDPAATIYVSNELDIHGAVNLHPKFRLN